MASTGGHNPTKTHTRFALFYFWLHSPSSGMNGLHGQLQGKQDLHKATTPLCISTESVDTLAHVHSRHLQLKTALVSEINIAQTFCFCRAMTPCRSSEQRHYLQDTFEELPDRSVAQAAVQTLDTVFTKTDTCPPAQCDHCTRHQHPQCLFPPPNVSDHLGYVLQEKKKKTKQSKLIKEMKKNNK